MKALILDCWSKFNIGKHRIGVVSLPLNFMSLKSAQGTRSSFTQHSGTCSTKQFSVISGWNREASENKAQSFLLQRTQTFTVIRKHVFANQIKFPWSVLNEGSQQIPMFQGKQKKSFHWAQLKKCYEDISTISQRIKKKKKKRNKGNDLFLHLFCVSYSWLKQ